MVMVLHACPAFCSHSTILWDLNSDSGIYTQRVVERGYTCFISDLTDKNNFI